MKIYAPGCGGPAWWSGDPEIKSMRAASGFYGPAVDPDITPTPPLMMTPAAPAVAQYDEPEEPDVGDDR